MATARRQSKDPLERLDTPRWCTRALLDRYRFIRGMDVIEPMAGARAISEVLVTEGGCAVRDFDIAPRAPSVHPGDVTDPDFWATQYRGESIVTNPAFSLASVVLRQWLRQRDRFSVLALLLRLSYLEATADRSDLPDPDGLIVLPRPRFIESSEARAIREAAGKKWGGDTVTVAWMIWQQHYPRPGIIRITRGQKAMYERAPVALEMSA